MSWHTGRLAAFDIETTGTDQEQDRIVTAAVTLLGGEMPTESRDWLLDPGIEIPPGAVAVHGVTNEIARAQGRDARQAVEEITALLAEQALADVPIVAFNARFDLTILDREARRHGIAPLLDRVGGPAAMRVIDPLVLDKHVDRFRKGKRTLDAVCAHYRVSHETAHSASADAIAAARVAYRLGATFAELAEMQLDELHASQVRWAVEQAASLQEYFERQGRREQVQGAWPLVPITVAAAA